MTAVIATKGKLSYQACADLYIKGEFNNRYRFAIRGDTLCWLSNTRKGDMHIADPKVATSITECVIQFFKIRYNISVECVLWIVAG